MNLSAEECPTSLGNCSQHMHKVGETSSKFSVLDNMPSLFKKKHISSDEADCIITSIANLLEELLSADKEMAYLSEYKDIAIEVLETLLPLCSPSVSNCCKFLLPQLVCCIKDPKNDTNYLTRVSSCIIALSLNDNNTDSTYIHETTDILSAYCVKNSKDFPFKLILDKLLECIKVLHQYNDEYEFICSHYEWPQNTRILVNRFLKTKTELITDDTRVSFFCLVKEVVETVGIEWFASDVSLLVLLVLVLVIQIRISLDKPESINTQILAVYFYILEMAIRCVEEPSFLEDSAATKIASSVREAALYSIEYWVKAKEEEENLKEEVEVVLYRFISCVLTIGGAEMLPEDLIWKCSPHLFHVFQRSITNGDCTTPRLLLPCLRFLPNLPEDTVISIVDLIISQFPDGEWKETIDEAIECVESLKSRSEFYNNETLAKARTRISATAPNLALYSRLCEIIEMIILSEVSQPTEGVRLSQPQVVAYMERESVGEGTLCVAERQVTWICRSSGLGFSLTYPSIVLHAISTDLSTFPHECIYVVVDASRSERHSRQGISFYTTAAAQNLEDLKLAEEELVHDGYNSDESDSEDESKNVTIRFVPSDVTVLQQIYNEMCACQELNPDEDDDFSDEEGDGFMAVDDEGDAVIRGDGWYSSQNMGDGDSLELTEVRHNMRHISNHSPNGLDENEEDGMDDSDVI
ncbi:Nucleotide-sensitive chloride conductance regulator [Dictyocaulus viviparus]|uniref:Methylosome subunit pICln n=1 Tax=Dictyocaulus viviparus TaxID=29172 RepID=A0A0D8XV98_DICVI|nr:Nucleotide-sensitive chloride conductance regulator [Dictyocaulus viviparus]